MLAVMELEQFNRNYLIYTQQDADTCADKASSSDCMFMRTSTIIDTETHKNSSFR